MEEEIILFYLEHIISIVILIAIFMFGVQLVFKSVFPRNMNLGIGRFIGNVISSLFKFIFQLIEGIISLVINIILGIFGILYDLILWIFRRKRRMYGSARFLNRRERNRLFSKKK